MYDDKKNEQVETEQNEAEFKEVEKNKHLKVPKHAYPKDLQDTQKKKILILIISICTLVILSAGAFYMLYLGTNKKNAENTGASITDTLESDDSLLEVVESSENGDLSQVDLQEADNSIIEAAIKSEEAKIKPSTGKVQTAPEFKYDKKDDIVKQNNIETKVDKSENAITQIVTPIVQPKDNSQENTTTQTQNSSKTTVSSENTSSPSSVTSSTQNETQSQVNIKYVVKVNGTYVNVRSGPGTKYEKIGQTNINDTYDYIDEKNDQDNRVWYGIKFNDKIGYITSEFSNKEKVESVLSKAETSTSSVSSSSQSSTPSSQAATSSTVSQNTASQTISSDVKENISINGWYDKDNKKYYYYNSNKLTGWQDIDGFRYYFNDQGVLCSQKGIDVSSHQGDINWKNVKTSGIEFAIIRVGFRGYETGRLVIDPKFYYNLTEAQKYGIKCGAYFYSVAKDEIEGAQEANFVVEALKGYKLDLPVVIDVEHRTDRVNGLSAEQRTNNTLAFLKTLQNNNMQTMVYTGHYYYQNLLQPDRLKEYKLWIAYYTNNQKNVADTPYSFWQYSDSGKVDGISGNVDLDIYIIK